MTSATAPNTGTTRRSAGARPGAGSGQPAPVRGMAFSIIVASVRVQQLAGVEAPLADPR